MSARLGDLSRRSLLTPNEKQVQKESSSPWSRSTWFRAISLVATLCSAFAISFVASARVGKPQIERFENSLSSTDSQLVTPTSKDAHVSRSTAPRNVSGETRVERRWERSLDDYFFGECESQCDPIMDFFKTFPSKSMVITTICVAFVPTHGFCFKSVNPKDPNLVIENAVKRNHYAGRARKFFTEVYRRLPPGLGGLALFINGDSADHFPDTVIDELWQRRVPLMPHCIRKRTTRNLLFMPDYHFMDSNAFLSLRMKFDRMNVSFAEKHPSVFWRGSTTGGTKECSTRKSTSQRDSHPCEDLPRVKLAKASATIPALDAHISKAVQCCSDYGETLLAKGLQTRHRSQEEWIAHRGIIDIDGNANAWGMFWRLASGSVVLRVMQDVPWTNHYLEHMREWEHYIPVHANFSDLEEKVALVASSDPENIRTLERIARNARRATEQFSYETAVTNLTAGLIQAWTRSNTSTWVDENNQ